MLPYMFIKKDIKYYSLIIFILQIKKHLMNKKTKVKGFKKLYEVERFLRMFQQNGVKYVMVKWKNFSQAHATKEPLESLRSLPFCKDELDKLQQDFDQRKYTQSLQNKIKEYYSVYNKTQSDKQNSSESDEDSSDSERVELGLQENVWCSEMAREQKIKKIRAGLKDIEAEDYFYFLDLFYKCQENVHFLQLQKRLPSTDSLLQKVKGVVQQQDGFRYCIKVNSMLYTCSFQEMIQNFPLQLTKFLQEFTSYMKLFMASQIKQYQELILNRNYRQKAVKKVFQVINIRNHHSVDNTQKDICFGVNQRHCMQNKQKEQQRKQYITNVLKEFSIQDSQLDQSIQKKRLLAPIYEEIMAKIDEIKKYYQQQQDSKSSINDSSPNEPEQSQSPSQQSQESPPANRSSPRLRERSKKSSSSPVLSSDRQGDLIYFDSDQSSSSQRKRKRVKRQ